MVHKQVNYKNTVWKFYYHCELISIQRRNQVQSWLQDIPVTPALVQRQPGKEDKKITSEVNPILAKLTELGSVILIEESLSINVVFRSKYQWIMTEYIKSSLAFNRGFEHWALSSKLRIIPS